MEMEKSPHALLLPYPVQGHVIPFLELSYRLLDHGFRITFVNTHFTHARVAATFTSDDGGKMRMVAIPDGMEEGEDRKKVGRLTDCILRTMPAALEKLISNINDVESGVDGGSKISCLIADGAMAFALKVAAKLGIRSAAFRTGSVEYWRLNFQIPKLLEDGVVDACGFPKKEQMIELSPAFPAMRATELPWLSIGDRASQQSIFRLLSECGLALEFADCLLSNSCSDIEQIACDLAPRVKTIGPLLASSRLRQFDGNFWREDTECLRWLDQQPPSSVIYVAFGSFTTLEKRQFQELALGLELCNRSFLWVVRPDLIDASSPDYFPDGFRARIGDRGKIVGWSPQQKVLAHPSIACFITHCGWNSTTEGLSNGVPFLCWPYFGDQKLNLAYICHIWKVGLALEKDGDGIISREEIRGKVQVLVGDEGIKARSLELKGIVRTSVVEGGSSFKNFNDFIEAMKQ